MTLYATFRMKIKINFIALMNQIIYWSLANPEKNSVAWKVAHSNLFDVVLNAIIFSFLHAKGEHKKLIKFPISDTISRVDLCFRDIWTQSFTSIVKFNFESSSFAFISKLIDFIRRPASHRMAIAAPRASTVYQFHSTRSGQGSIG